MRNTPCDPQSEARCETLAGSQDPSIEPRGQYHDRGWIEACDQGQNFQAVFSAKRQSTMMKSKRSPVSRSALVSSIDAAQLTL